jgi:peptide/nickel transport system substrate-binding protein
MGKTKKFSRRHFLFTVATTTAASVLAACGGAPATTPAQPPAADVPATNPPAPATAAAPSAATTAPVAATSGQYKEAPMLAERVTQGLLPPVDERLPKNPLVVPPVERVGAYGGTWRSGLRGGQDSAWLTRTLNYENLVRWDPEWKEVVPNVVESFEINDDGTEYTFKLREGLKWSDGEPYTADDIIFWWEDVVNVKEIAPGGPPNWMKTGPDREVGAVEKIDDYTVVFKFKQPNGMLLQNLATPNAPGATTHPKHYLQQFHQKYNTTNLDQLITDNKATDWGNLFQLKGASIPNTPYEARWQNAELPTMHGWMFTTAYGEGATQVVAERNPYYFKVDTEGNQLPYIDKLQYEVGDDVEVLVLKALNGEIDMTMRHVNTLANKAVFTDNMQMGDYRFFEAVPSGMNTAIVALNLTHQDPVKREIFRNKDFRIGLSHAINRQEIIDLVYIGEGEPWQAAPRRESEFFNETLAKQYTEYDVAKANEYLDKAGYAQRDANGIRLGPDSKPISFAIEINSNATERVDVLNEIVKYWQAVGIDAQVKSEDRALMYTRKNANEHDAVVWGGDGGLDVTLEPRWYFPYSDESNFAQAWTAWYNPSALPQTKAEEPPAEAKQQQELYEQLRATADPAQQAEYMKQILEIAAEQFYVIGISLEPTGYGIAKNNFRNVPESMPSAWLYPSPAPYNPAQFFIEG